MNTITFTSKIGGVLADVTTVKLSDPDGSYGVRRVDTEEVAVAEGAAMTNIATGTYTYSFAGVGGVQYQYYVEWVYAGETYYVEKFFTAAGDAASLTGLTLKQVLRSILANDAVLTGSDNLGTLLEYNATTKPDTVFFQYPPERISPPLLTYRISGEAGRFPHNFFLDVVVWGGDFRAISDRVYDLLNGRIEVAASDWQVKGILYESSGPEIWDENLKCYYQRARYRIVTLRL